MAWAETINYNPQRRFEMEVGEDGHIIKEEKLLLGKVDGSGSEQRCRNKRGWYRLSLLTFVGCCIGLFWLFSDCLVASHGEQHEVTSASLDLVKNAARAPAATPSTAVLECFQVYQPVLFPSGAVDETVTSDGSDNTTTIAPTASASSCEVLLMEHSFGFSYGIPFVGMPLRLPYYSTVLTDIPRRLQTSILQVQPRGNELHCHFERSSI
jgi:hypothetical protein